MHGRPHPTQQACGRQRARTPTPSKCCPGGAADHPRGGEGASVPPRRIELPRLRRAAVGILLASTRPNAAASQVTALPALGATAQTRKPAEHGQHSPIVNGVKRSRETDRDCERAATATVQRGMPPLQRSHSTAMHPLSSRAVPSLTGVTTSEAVRRGVDPGCRRWCASSADRRRWNSHSLSPSRTESNGGTDNSLRAACVLPVVADRSGVFHFPGASQAAVRKGGVDHRSVRAAGGGCKMAQKCMQHTPGTGAMPGKQSRMAESGAHGVKGQSISQSPGSARAQSVEKTVGIAAHATRTL
ncbi:hypothetical protein TcYC6_0007030 [Trypanosoma cruzi]|nr:hypothetical protein TcYC6_0007030 [Trypanosoma cruzi]